METYESFGFVPDLSLSIHLNTRDVLGSTTLECYFQHSMNKTFHDLTKGRSLPAAAMSIIGMEMKFIPMPAWTTSDDSIKASIDCFERNISLKVYFAGDNEDKEVKKLRIKLIWQAPLPPFKIDSRISKFLGAIKRLLSKKQGKPNLNNFQRGVLKKIRNNHNVVIAHANKGLGPIGIELPKYIRWALDEHLLNKTTYSIVPEEQAFHDALTLYKNVATWLSKYSAILSPNAKKFIQKKIGGNN
jgi:hypothetical protein